MKVTWLFNLHRGHTARVWFDQWERCNFKAGKVPSFGSWLIGIIRLCWQFVSLYAL